MQVLWSEDAERLLLALAPSRAEGIIDAVEALANHGRGFVRRTFDPPERQLYIKGFAITFDVRDGVMFVVLVRRLTR